MMAITRLNMMIFIAIAVASLRATAGCALKPGDRVVFLGDSITEARHYSRFVIDYFTLRHPQVEIAFRNVGMAGDTAEGSIGRLKEDVLSLNPTVVTIVLGINDAVRHRYKGDAHLKWYMTSMSNLVEALTENGVRVVLLSATCVDPDRRAEKDGDECNRILTKFAEGVKELANSKGLAFHDLFNVMLNIQKRGKADDPKFSIVPDSIHPDSGGHAAIAFAILKAMGCDEQASSLEIDASSATSSTDRCTISNLMINERGIEFTRRDQALPAYLPIDTTAEVARILKYLPFEKELNQYAFKVKGLKGGKWTLKADEITIGSFSSEQLSAGVNLAHLPGPWRKLGERVNRIAVEQEALFYARWRNLQRGGLPPEVRDELLALIKKIDDVIAAKEQDRRKLVADTVWKWKLIPE